MRAATMPAADAGRERSPAMRSTLGWLERLALLTEAQLSALLNVDDRQVRALLRDLGQEALVGSVIADSPEFVEALRLYHLTDAGVRTAARCLGVDVADLLGSLPAAGDELLARLARMEMAVGVADTVAGLADATRRAEGGAAVTLEDAGGTHWAPHRGRSVGFPPAVEAWVRLRAGGLRATALLAWDRAGAPRAHRRARVAAWYRADERRDAPWGPGLPPLLVVCPGEVVAAQWDALVDGSATWRGRSLLRIAVATVREFTSQGPFAPIWRRPGRGAWVGLVDVLAWQDAPSARTWPEPTAAMTGRLRPGLATANEGDRPACRHAPVGTGAMSGRMGAMTSRRPVERHAAIAMAVSATQKMLLLWVAQHPLLPAGYLAAVVGLPARMVTELLERLRRHGLIALDTTPGFDVAAGPRYVLSRGGADWLAARDGVPLHVYLHEGTLAADISGTEPLHGGRSRALDGCVRLMDLRRRPEHTMGVHRVVLALAREAQRERALGHHHRLLAWLNAVEAQAWYRGPSGVGHVWPDAQFRYRIDGDVHDLLLEWDRGLVRQREYVRKFQQYAAFYAALGTTSRRPPRLVVVTPPVAVARVRAAMDAEARCGPLLRRVTTVLAVDVVTEDRVMAALQEAWWGVHGASRPQSAPG